MGRQDDQAVLMHISEGKHLKLRGRIAAFFGVGQTRSIAVMSVRDDTALCTHHFHDLLYILFVSDRKDTMPYILLIHKVDKRFLLSGLSHNCIGDFLPVFIEHKNQTEISGRCLLKTEPVNHRLVENLFVRLDNLAEIFKFG